MNLFALGRILIAPEALRALEEAGHDVWEFLNRHVSGDWGELDAEDRSLNDHAVRYGGRILSAYRTRLGVRVWVITEADRSATTLLLPE